MHVVERQPRAREGPLPGGPFVPYGLIRFGEFNGLRQVGLRTLELSAPSAPLVVRKPLLQRLVNGPLQS